MGLFSSFQPGGDDYGSGSVVVTFEAGSRFSTYASIPIIPDGVKECDEQFRATFELPGGYRNLNKGDPEEESLLLKMSQVRHSVCVSVYVCIQKYPCHR